MNERLSVHVTHHINANTLDVRANLKWEGMYFLIVNWRGKKPTKPNYIYLQVLKTICNYEKIAKSSNRGIWISFYFFT